VLYRLTAIGQVQDPALRGAELNGFAGEDGWWSWSTEIFEYWSIAKYQIPSTKLQTNLKFQYSMTKTKNRFGISNFGHCDLFDICDL
jgi:hypothetical protein